MFFIVYQKIMNQKELMESLLNYWKENNTFQRSIDERSDRLEPITYDGPPFASGTPHFGHGLVWVMKDLVWRYKSMKWYKLIRDWWRDCHWLPVEKAVEKQLWIDWKRDIEEKLWIDKFTQECRNYVSNVSDEWTWFVDHIGRRADMKNAYMTMNLDFMESVINVFDNLYSKNLIYKWFKVQWFCPSCATALSNSEVNEWYEDRQDPAITIKFQLSNKAFAEKDNYETVSDWAVNVVCCLIKREWKILIWYHTKGQKYVFPGWKVEKWDSIEKTVSKEIMEELWVEVKSQKVLWEFKELLRWNIWNLIYVETEIEWEPKNMEPDKTTHLQRAEIIESENKIWMAVKIENTIIDDADEIINQFYDLYTYHNNFAGQIQKDAPVYALAWTTTPWTLPSNSFLAVGPEIYYCMVYDKDSHEYYVLWEALLKKYYKNSDEYLLINRIKWSNLVWTFYKPLFEYINQSKMPDKYKEKYFQIIPWDYVSTDDGTWIVHIAPSFWVEDFEVVAAIFPREFAREWLFLPVDDYGEFTDDVPDYKWRRVYDVNKDINDRLKKEWKLVLLQSHNHSYPHCWRCHTALISKAMDSRFIKEPELKEQNIANAKEIWFVPESVKKRFLDVLDSAPDWNLSRNRYRWSPIPIWQNDADSEDRLSIGTLDEIYQNTINGSKNLTKNIFIRHGETEFNVAHKWDCLWEWTLTEKWKERAETVKENLDYELKEWNEFVVVLSPLKRTLETAAPFLIEKFGTSIIDEITPKYNEIVEKFQSMYKDWSLIEYTTNPDNQQLFELHEWIYVDMRTHETYYPSMQWVEFHCMNMTSVPTNEKLFPDGETVDHIFERIESFIQDVNGKFRTKTIITFTHWESIVSAIHFFRNFDYHNRRDYFYPYINWPIAQKIKIHYYDNDTGKELDLHRPHVDNYRFNIDWKTYHRIPEVMDCRFESGSMPFGQVWYIRRKDGTTRSMKPLIYPADWIMEWLDQTRGWFRVMHVLGNAMMWRNSYDNVVINWLILAEDGRKMSKSLNNYPDPRELFQRYGADAYRLYVLSSPAVKAEPMRFAEKWVDQVYKDFTSSLTNAYKFFETYAKVDNFKTDNTNMYFMRHASATWYDLDDQLTAEWIASMEDEAFISKVLRLDLDKIYTSHAQRTKQTADRIQEIYKEYINKDIEVIEDEKLWQEWYEKTVDCYNEILAKEKWNNILMVSHDVNFAQLWKDLYWKKNDLLKWEIVKLPSYKITNDLDRWILATLNETGIQVQKEMEEYHLDNATKAMMWFVDSLTNWYIRRSRRRFRASWMDQDKISAYSTLFDVLNNFVKIAAPFAPFISEHIYLELQQFTNKWKIEWDSVHLKYYPISSERYIDPELIQEIALVRKIITLWLFIRSKNNIKIKQPLAKMEVKI